MGPRLVYDSGSEGAAAAAAAAARSRFHAAVMKTNRHHFLYVTQ